MRHLCPAHWEKNKWVAESVKIGSVFFCSKNIKKILKKYQKTIDKRKLMWYNKTYPKEKEVKRVKFLKALGKAIVKIYDVFVFVLTGKGEIGKEMVDADLISYEGQGRDRYGR